MVLYLINIGLSVGKFSLQVLVSFELERWSSQRRKRAYAEAEVHDVVPVPNATYRETWQLATARSQASRSATTMATIFGAGRDPQRRCGLRCHRSASVRRDQLPQ
jgi:hypothetical protein